MLRLCAVFLGLMAFCFATGANSRTLQYPVIFIHGIWSDATTWETAIKQLTDRGYVYGGVVSASYSNGVPSTAGCVPASLRNNKSPTVYLSACNPNADFFVWETNDYSMQSTFASNNDHSFSELGGEVKFAIDYVRSLTGASKVQLVAHSMGGIAARHYLQNLHRSGADFAGDVATLVTIGTPHSGSAVANACPVLAPGATVATAAVCTRLARPSQVQDCYDAVRYLHTICSGQAVSRLRTDSWALQVMNACLTSATGLCAPDNVSAGKAHTLPSGVTYLAIVASTKPDGSDLLVSAASQEFPPAGAYPKQVMSTHMTHIQETSSLEVLATVFSAVGATNYSQANAKTQAPRVDLTNARFVMVGSVEASRANVGSVTVDTHFRYALAQSDLEHNFSVMPNQRFILAPGERRDFWSAAFSDSRIPIGRLVYYQACVSFAGLVNAPCDVQTSMVTSVGNTPLPAPLAAISNPQRGDAGPSVNFANLTLPVVLSWS